MRILAWLLATLIAYGVGGLWVGGQLRPAVEQERQMIEQNVSAVARVLGR